MDIEQVRTEGLRLQEEIREAVSALVEDYQSRSCCGISDVTIPMVDVTRISDKHSRFMVGEVTVRIDLLRNR